MPFCPNCGIWLHPDASFCSNCGIAPSSFDAGYPPPKGDPVVVSTEPKQKRIRVKKKTRGEAQGESAFGDSKPDEQASEGESCDAAQPEDFKGAVVEIKCPACGERIPSFTDVCPSCGHEIRGAISSSSTREFATKVEKAKSQEQLALIIKNHPIPNSREDILEFMMLASANSGSAASLQEIEAWEAMLDQCFQKAQFTIKDPKDKAKTEEIYSEAKGSIRKKKNGKKAKSVVSKILGLPPVVFVIIIAVAASIILSSIDESLGILAGFVSFFIVVIMLSNSSLEKGGD